MLLGWACVAGQFLFDRRVASGCDGGSVGRRMRVAVGWRVELVIVVMDAVAAGSKRGGGYRVKGRRRLIRWA